MAERRELLSIQGYQVSAELFSTGYAAGSGPCNCSSNCCARGAYVDLAERDRILAHAELIKPHLDDTQNRDAAHWFEAETKPDKDYASGTCIGTAVIADKCALLDGQGRCSIQVAMVAAGKDRWTLKPLYCVLFPLEVVDHVIRFDATFQNQRACCSVQSTFQVPLFQACREELVHLLGEDGFALLQDHYAAHYALPSALIERPRHLPVYPAE
jgi:hypothetical protein